MKKLNTSAFAIGASLVTGLASTAVIADNNPFALTELSSGYMNLAEADTDQGDNKKMKDGACGEGKCGGKMAVPAAEDKAQEGKCANKKMATDKNTEGKCGDKK